MPYVGMLFFKHAITALTQTAVPGDLRMEDCALEELVYPLLGAGYAATGMLRLFEVMSGVSNSGIKDTGFSMRATQGQCQTKRFGRNSKSTTRPRPED